MFPSLVDAVRRNTVNTNDGKLGWSHAQCETVAALQPYDLGGLFLPRGSHPECVDDDTWMAYAEEVNSEINGNGLDITGTSGWAIEFLWMVRGNLTTMVVPTPDLYLTEAVRRGGSVYCFAFYAGEWHLEMVDAQLTMAVALKMVRDAELNVEFIERPDKETDRVNRGRVLGKRPPIRNTRVISVSKLRKQYRGGPREAHQGGTHARPREHTRVITDREIVCKDGRRYRRKAQVVTVNAGVTRVTKVVL